MGVILHLSDVHLGKAPAEEIADDYKDEFVPLEQRTNRHTTLRWTLEALKDVVQPQPLSAVAFSGDLTVAYHEDGYAQFEELLEALGPLRPTNDRIVVVPGNHDVKRHTPPGSEERYELFNKYIRSANYVTPLLDGTDIDAHGKFVGDPALRHFVLDEDEGWIIIPINSSDYSVALEPLSNFSNDEWEETMATVEAKVGPDAAHDLNRLRTQDAARVSPAQLQGLLDLLRNVDAGAKGSPTIRIAVVHHQLLPVSVREEVKSYESITNLGLVRNFLRENVINLVLHGHKHRETVYKDHIYPPEGFFGGQSHEVVVLAGATIGTADWDQANVCRLIQIEGAPRATRIAIAAVRSKTAGVALATPTFETIPLWQPQEDPLSREVPRFVTGRDVDETYERLVSLLAQEGSLAHVVCRVEDPISAERLPEAYPEVPDIAADARQAWYDDMVHWWQKPNSKLRERLNFTHGARISRASGDQIEAAAQALRRETFTSRAVITLLEPTLDEVAEIEHKFPAFCLIHLQPRERAGERYLDCVGHFRKQQMRYWWPINLGELRHVQKLALDELGGEHAKYRAGALWTVTATAVLGDTVPRVAVPLVDRIYDEDEERLWMLAYAVAWEGIADRATRAAELIAMIDELVPKENFDPDGVPVALEGLAELAAVLTRFGQYHSDSPAVELGECLREVYRANSTYDQKTASEVTAAAHTAWRQEVIPLVEQARGLLQPLANGG